MSEMSSEEKTAYSMGDFPVKPKVLRARLPLRMIIFPPRPEERQFRDYRDYYPECLGISYSPIRPRFDPHQVHGDMAEHKVTRTSTPAPQQESISRSDVQPEGLFTMETIQDPVKTAVDSLVEALTSQTSQKYKLPAVQVPRYKTGADWRMFKAEFKQTMSMADLKPLLQMAHLRKTVPEEAKKLLYQEHIESVDRAFGSTHGVI